MGLPGDRMKHKKIIKFPLKLKVIDSDCNDIPCATHIVDAEEVLVHVLSDTEREIAPMIIALVNALK